MKRTCGGVHAMSTSEKKTRLALRFKSMRKRRKFKPREKYINQQSPQKLPYSKFDFSPTTSLNAEERIRSTITDNESDCCRKEHTSENLELEAPSQLSFEAENEIPSMERERVEVEKSVDQPESQNSTNLLKTISDQMTMNSDSEVRFSGYEDGAAFSDKAKMTLDEFCLHHKLSAFSSNLLKEFGHTVGRVTDVLSAINTDSSRLNKILGIKHDLTADQMTHLFIQISGHKMAKSKLTQHQK